MMWLARFDSPSRALLQFLGFNGPTWITLYGLLDFMKNAGMSDADVANAAGSSVTQLKKFTGTANNFTVLGPFCRHGPKGWIPPANPMTLEDAAKLILPAAKRHLKNRLRELDLEGQWKRSREQAPGPG